VIELYWHVNPENLYGHIAINENSFTNIADITRILTKAMIGSMSPRSVRFGVRSRKWRNFGQSLDGWPKIYYLELFRASEGTLSCRSRLHLQSLAPTNHWAGVVGYGPFSLRVIHKEGLCRSSGDINRLMMMMNNRLDFMQPTSRLVGPSLMVTYLTYTIPWRNLINY
jgi:hypothetical protein